MRREKTGRAGKSAEERGSGRKEGERLLSRQKNFRRERGELWRERKERGKREESFPEREKERGREGRQRERE